MKNKRYNRNIFGCKPTQKTAQEVLPILVSYAQGKQTLIMRNLAKEVIPDRPRFNWYMGWALAWIQTTLYELERSDNWKYGEIPCITTIVLDSPQQPTKNMAKRSRIEAGLDTPLPWRDYEKDHILPVFKYPHWEQVMDFVIGKLR